MSNKEIVVHEIATAFSMIGDEQIEQLTDELLRARRVLVIGVGRVLLSLKAWVKRMTHLDIDINFVGSETEKPVGEQDLLLAASASGESVIPVQIARIAKKHGARIAYIGCSPQSTVASLADFVFYVPGKSKFNKEGEFSSVQPMSTLFEQVLYLLCDAVALELMQRRGMDEAEFKTRHANLE